MQAIHQEILKSNLDRLLQGVEDLKKALDNFQQALDGLKPIIEVLLEQEGGSA
jgi:hypothetical protein